MVLATQTPSEDEDDGLSAGIIALIVILSTLFVLILVVTFVVYLVYRRKRKSKYSISASLIHYQDYGGADYIADNTAVNLSYFSVQQIQNSQVQEMVSTEPEDLKEKSLKEDNADDDDFVIKENLYVDDDKNTHL